MGGCNDCHTDGYLHSEGDVPEDQWLTGLPIGFRGPWGTTYGTNLRLLVQEIAEDAWVEILLTGKSPPPMPWMNSNQLAEEDAQALYQYIKSLGPAGEPMPNSVPPDQEPVTPYMLLSPVEPQAE
jgi:mono/diheme cytochrome c family protein